MSVEKRRDRWRARYRGADGRERNKSFARKIDAQRWLADQKVRMSRGEWVDPAALRIEFGIVAREWFATATLHLKPKTRSGYERLLYGRLLPRWEHVPLGKLNDLTREWVVQLISEGLSSSRVRQILQAYSAICQYAILTKRLLINPVAGIKLPKTKALKERVFLNHAEVAKLVDAVGPSGVFVRTLAYTGLRWGEATALRVRDASLDRRRLHVVRAFSDVGGKLEEGTPKNHQARTVPLPPSLCRDLDHLVKDRKPDALVFTAPKGGPLRYTNFRRKTWYPAVVATGLDGLTVHGLRHTAASLYISAGAPPKVVQRILGHASITITMDLYGHLYPDEMDTWAERLDEIAGDGGMWPECGQPGPSNDGEEAAG